MAEIVRFQNDQGTSVLVETAGSSPVMREVGGRDVFRVADEKFEAILGKIRDLSDLVARELSELASEPDEIMVELGVSVNAEAEVFIAKASAEGSMKVTLSWGKGSARGIRRR
ncbi:CU044_2847 family protein [Allosalinactinospora lopnorensis]|uniref:CU044_2847 family protein n=1 Tax=Allosalinactinospora lopnorensis TaxID=1352348 RepID=UPI000623FFE0|nr:CU044_2847 family protein [Allosalinactinospora lopnorensis]